MGSSSGIAAFGGLANAMANREAANSEIASLLDEIEADKIEAADILERFEVNKFLTVQEGEAFKQEQIGAFIKSGVDIGTGSPLLTLEQTSSAIAREIEIAQMEAESEIKALETGIEGKKRSTSRLRGARDIRTFADILGGAGTAARARRFDSKSGSKTSNTGRSPAIGGRKRER